MTLPASLTDIYLLNKIRRGDTKAFATLYDRHVGRIYTLLSRLTGSADIADDLTQETFVSAYRSLPSYEGRGAFSTWLWGIALRTYRNYCRYSKRIPETEPLDDDEAFTSPLDTDPLAASTRRDAQEALDRAIQALPTGAREVFVLVRIEEMTYQQAADQLDIPLGTVQSRLHRATFLLHRALSPLIYEGDSTASVHAPKGAKHVIR